MDADQLNGFVHGKGITPGEFGPSTKEYAARLDSQDKLSHFRSEFLIPSKADLKDPHPETKPVDQQNGTW